MVGPIKIDIINEAIHKTWYILFDNQEFYTKSELLSEFCKDLRKELGIKK